MSVKVGDKVKAKVVRPYNGHEFWMHGTVLFVNETKFVVSDDFTKRTISFLLSDIDDTVFIKTEDEKMSELDPYGVKPNIKDSGERRTFETGAVRDMAEGKGRCDLLPACALLRLARHYENGAKKYADRNWEIGIPVSVMIDSGLRHILKYLDGAMDEDHLAAAAWNILGAMWMEEKKPELQDLPGRKIIANSKKELENLEI